MKSISRREFTPIGHRITGIRLADATSGFVLTDNREVPGWSRGATPADVRLRGHKQSFAFHHVDCLRASGKLHSHARRIVRLVGNYVISPSSGGQSASGLATGKHRKSGW